MEIRNSTYTKIAKIINGDTGIAPYMSGPSLIDFFSNFGFDDNYGNGFPSRWIYAEARVKEIFELKKYNDFFTAILDEYRFADTDFNSEIVLEEINKHLSFDNYKVIKNGKKFVLNSLDGHIVNITEEHLEILSTEFLLEQINKCEDKIRNEDYDGAITNSRSLVEEVQQSYYSLSFNKHLLFFSIVKLLDKCKKVNFSGSILKLEGKYILLQFSYI